MDYVKIPGQGRLVAFVNSAEKTNSISDEFGRSKAEIANLSLQDIINQSTQVIIELLKSIYGRDFWVRDKAFIMDHSANLAKDHIQASWHIDGFNQITLTLLLEDSAEDAVATKIIPGSSKEKWDFDRSNITPIDLKSDKFVGHKSDLFVFFGGGSLHRSYIGRSGRKAVFINLSSGWYEAGVL